MKKLLILTATIGLVVALAGTQALAGVVVFSDNFDTQIDPTVWTQVTPASPLTWDGTKDCGGSPTSGSAKTTLSVSRMYHNLGVDLNTYFKATWWVFDDTMTRAYGEMESRVGGVYTGALNQLFAAGKYNSTTMPGEVWDVNYYQGRILYPSATLGWFNLNATGAPKRSAGWHKFDIERLSDGTLNFSVDNFLCRTFTGASSASMNVIVLGFGTTSSSNGNAWFDSPKVYVPEPGSLLALATGLVGLVGILRRRT